MKKLIAALVIMVTSQLSVGQVNIEPITWKISSKKIADRLFDVRCSAIIHPDYGLMSQIQYHDSLASIVYKLFPTQARGIGAAEEVGVPIRDSSRRITYYKDTMEFKFIIRTSVDSVRIGVELEYKLLYENKILQPKARRLSRTLLNTKQDNETSIRNFDDRATNNPYVGEPREGTNNNER
jgi:hypothetical protein